MRALRPRFLTAFGIIAGACATVAKADNAIGWQSSIPTAQKIAADSNRLVLIHFWGLTCQPCARLDQEVFTQPEVARALQAQYVPVKINADFSPTTAREYGVTALPTDIVITPSGQVIEKFISPSGASRYIEKINHVASTARSQQVAVAGAQPSGPSGNSSLPAISTGSTVFNSPAASPPVAAMPVSTGVAQTAATSPAPSSGGASSTSPYNNDSYAEYLRQRAATTPSNQPASQPAATAAAPSANAWQQGSAAPSAPVASAPVTPSYQPVAQQPTSNAFTQSPAPTQQAAAASPAPAIQLPAGSPPLGLDGYCPVRLREEYRWVLGDRRYGAVHRGRTYLFSGPGEQQKFLANPDAYSPMMSGYDPVLALDHGQTVPGQRNRGVMFGEGQNARVILFASEDSLKRFSGDPERYAAQIRQAEAPTRGPMR